MEDRIVQAKVERWDEIFDKKRKWEEEDLKVVYSSKPISSDGSSAGGKFSE